MSDFDKSGDPEICMSLSRGQIPCDDTDFSTKFNEEFDLLRSYLFTKGARFIYDGKVRLVYDSQIKKIKQRYNNKINTGQMTEEQAGWRAKDMRNRIMKYARRFTHPIGLVMAKTKKQSGLSDADALKSAVINWHSKQNLPENLPENMKDQMVLARKKELKQNFELEKQKLLQLNKNQWSEVFKEMIDGASRSNQDVNNSLGIPKEFDLFERRLFLMSIAISALNVLFSDDPTAAIMHEFAVNFVLFVGGFVGGGLASAYACSGTGSEALLCVTVASIMSGAFALQGYESYSKRGK